MVTFNPPQSFVLFTVPQQNLGNNDEGPSSTVAASSQVPAPAAVTVP